jgi:hypothetical protein
VTSCHPVVASSFGPRSAAPEDNGADRMHVPRASLAQLPRECTDKGRPSDLGRRFNENRINEKYMENKEALVFPFRPMGLTFPKYRP